MKLTKKFFAMILICLSMISSTAFAEIQINKEKNIITAIGKGFGPKSGQAGNIFFKAHSRQVAQLDALRQLSEAISGVNIDNVSKVTVDDKSIALVAKYAKVIDVKFLAGDICEVTMQMSLDHKK